MFSVCLSSASSLVFPFHLYNLLFQFRLQFSLLYNSSNSFPVAIFHICFHCILTAFQVWYLHIQYNREHSLQKLSSCQFSVGTKAGKVMQDVVFVSQVVQPLTTRVTFFSV